MNIWTFLAPALASLLIQFGKDHIKGATASALSVIGPLLGAASGLLAAVVSGDVNSTTLSLNGVIGAFVSPGVHNTLLSGDKLPSRVIKSLSGTIFNAPSSPTATKPLEPTIPPDTPKP